MKITHIVRVVAAALALGCGSAAFGQTVYSEGQKIEVREGDTWSGATILKREGRRYLIRYDGTDESSDEWVMTDRMRTEAGTGAAGAGAAGAAGTGAAGAETAAGDDARPAASGTAPATPVKPKPAPQWASGQKVEVKWGSFWRGGKIVNRRDDWYLVEYEAFARREWVEPWRIRRMGSTEDTIGHAQPNSTAFKEGPPNRKPGEPPKPFQITSLEMKEEEAAKADPAWKEVDPAGAVLLDLRSPGRNWKLALDVPDPAATGLALRSIALKGASRDHLDAVKSLVIPRAKPTWAYACHVGSTPGQTSVRLERIDLATGVSTALWTMEPDTAMLDISPDGNTALFRTDGFGFGKSGMVEVWSLEGEEPRKTLKFKPFMANRMGMGANISGGLFVDDTHILLWSEDGTLTMWDLKAIKPVYSCSINRGCVPALSANGKYLAINIGQQALLLEMPGGKVVAEMTMDTPSGAAFSFSPSGRQLAAWADGSVRAWSLENGWPISEFSTPQGIGGLTLRMVADGYGLVDGAYLLDFDRRAVLWYYRGARSHTIQPDAITAGGEYLYIFREDRAQARLVMAKLPHAQALRAAEAIGAQAEMLLKPGVKVSLRVDLSEEQQEITDALTARIKEAGLVLADNQPMVFRASLEQGTSTQQEYTDRRTGHTETVTSTQQICRLVLEVDGKVAWQRQTIAQPSSMLTMREGQSAQDAANESGRARTSFLMTVRLPRYLPKSGDSIWYGSSSLSAHGVTAQ
jgi:hypothetical protein